MGGGVDGTVNRNAEEHGVRTYHVLLDRGRGPRNEIEYTDWCFLIAFRDILSGLYKSE